GDAVAEKPTTYRPTGANRPSISPQQSAQQREQKLMNVLAARRSALQRGGFRTRIGTTGRSATSPAAAAAAAVESTSKPPSDPRSVCIRNCTKNFTRRTTASCMRQCANFTRMGMPSSSNNSAVRASVLNGERDTNEILFSDESSHGLFVVAKEQNDTLNHIADGAKTATASKQRGRGKPLATVTLATTSVEQADDEDELQPYLYFGAKLPPLKPNALTITPAEGDDEHTRVLEVSVVQPAPSSTTAQPTVRPTVSTRRPLSEVERSRSRYKYHMRERGLTPTPAPPVVQPISRTRYLGSGRPTAGLGEERRRQPSSTANCESAQNKQQLPQYTTDASASSKILRTTVLTSVRSTVNPRTTSTAPTTTSSSSPKQFIGIVETSSSSSSSSSVVPLDISSTAIADERDVNLELRRMNLVALVLVAVGIVPLAAIILYLVRNYVVRRQAKQDEVFDVCIADQQPIKPHMLIMEYAMRGRLLSLLRAARSANNILPASVPGGRSLAPLSPRTLAGFALDIACGMEYIAGRRVVHRDLAARNVLLDHNGMCKICDFGMSIDLDAERLRKAQEKNAANDILRSHSGHNSHKFKFDFG
ncbi:Tie, partial [Drosophila busckii]